MNFKPARRGPRRNAGGRFRRRPRGPRLISGFVDTSATHTFSLGAYVSLVGGVGTLNVLWQDFAGFHSMKDFYLYFTPLSYRLEVPLQAGTQAIPEIQAILPVNWITDLPLALPTPEFGALSEMRGNVLSQAGSSNRGPWVRWPPLTQQLNSQLSSPEIACVVLVAGAGTVTGVSVRVSINIRFYRRNPLSFLNKDQYTLLTPTALPIWDKINLLPPGDSSPIRNDVMKASESSRGAVCASRTVSKGRAA